MSTLQVQRREPNEKLSKLRQAGFLPMALLQKDHTTDLIKTNEDDLRRAIQAADGLGRVDVQLDGGSTMKAVVRDIEKNVMTHRLIHAVLQVVTEDDTMKMDLAVIAVGTSPAVSDGLGTLLQPTDHIKVKGKMSSIPDHLEVDVSHLGLGDHIVAGDIALPEGISLVTSAEAMIFTISVAKVAVETEESVSTESAGESSAT